MSEQETPEIEEDVPQIEEEDDNINDILDNDSDAEELTASEVIKLMEEAWMNEKFSPEVLPHKMDVVECLLSQITSMEENLENLESTDFTKTLYQLEVDRLRYLITSYLRNRLEKIERFCAALIKEEEARSANNQDVYLSDAELQFAREYLESIEHHFESVLSFWPGMPPDDWKQKQPKPNLHSFVFVKSKKDIEGVVIDAGNEEEDDLVDLKAGSRMIISYKSISYLLKKGDITLI